MTITTAKLARAIWHAYGRALPLPLVALSALLIAPNARADWKFIPSLDLRQVYTDNVTLQGEALERGQFVTEIAPGLAVRHKGPRLALNAKYEYHYFATDHDLEGTKRSARMFKSDAKAKLVDELLYVDATAGIAQQGISPFAQMDNDNAYASANRTEVKTWRISPYLVNRFGRLASSELRYMHDSVDAGYAGLGDSSSDSLSFRLNSGAAFRDLGWGLAASEQRIQDSFRNDSTIQTANLNLRYRVAPTVNLTAGVNYDNYDYDALGGVNGGRGWDTGFSWTPSRRTSLQASVGRRYYGPSRSLTAQHRSRRTVWSINYSDSVTSTRSNFLLPATVDTAAMVDGLLTPSFPDPVARARAVEEYIRSAGLPASLADNINYFSNRYSLQKQLRASMAFRSARTSTVYSVYKVRREALSVRETDSTLLGSSINTINDNTDQRGFNASLNYRVSPKTGVNLSANIADNESLTTGFKARSSAVRLNLRHRIRARLTATAELRHVEGVTGIVSGNPYTENAVSVALSMQL